MTALVRLERELEVAQELALAAGASLRSYHSKKLHIVHRGGGEKMVTIADLIADDIIMSGLQQSFPRDALCSEQTPISCVHFECERIWLIDAMDGATNFAEQGDEYTVSIGLAVRGQAVLGVVYNPTRNELFAGSAAQPTTINGFPVNPGMSDQFAGVRISVPSSEWAYSSRLPGLKSVLPIASTSYGLARVAAGMDDGFFCLLHARKWSTCAGVALVGAAGRRATLPGSVDISYDNGNLTHPFGMTAAGASLHRLLDRAHTGLLHWRLGLATPCQDE
jgi:myo-inositol-1(or 4)-monophosphatase